MAKLIVIATSLSFEICTFYSLSWTHCMYVCMYVCLYVHTVYSSWENWSSVHYILLLLQIRIYVLASERKWDTYSGNTIESRDVCLFICLDVRMSFCTLTLTFLCLLGGRSRPNTPLNRILWFVYLYPHHCLTLWIIFQVQFNLTNLLEFMFYSD